MRMMGIEMVLCGAVLRSDWLHGAVCAPSDTCFGDGCHFPGVKVGRDRLREQMCLPLRRPLRALVKLDGMSGERVARAS